MNLAAQYQTAQDFIPATSSAYRLGILSAQLGEEPTMTFLFRHERKDYVRGYRDFVESTTKEQVQ